MHSRREPARIRPEARRPTDRFVSGAASYLAAHGYDADEIAEVLRRELGAAAAQVDRCAPGDTSPIRVHPPARGSAPVRTRPVPSNTLQAS